MRRFYDGPLVLSGAIANGRNILAAQTIGADLAYMGTRFIATEEAQASAAYKQALVEASAEDIVYTPYFTGVAGNYVKASIVQAGLDPDNLPLRDKRAMNFDNAAAKAWRDIWGAGQSVSGVDRVLPTAALIARLRAEYAAAREEMGHKTAGFF